MSAYWCCRASENLDDFQYSGTSMARTGLEPLKIILAKGSSSHPVWIMHKTTYRDHNDSSGQPRVRAIEVLLYMFKSFSPYMSINFELQGKCLYLDSSRCAVVTFPV